MAKAQSKNGNNLKAVVEPPVQKATEKIPVEDLGATGLKYAGFGDWAASIEEEFLRELQGERGRKIYREMRDNDPSVGAMMFIVEALIRNLKWFVQGDDQEQCDFVESCMYDMDDSWDDFIAEILSMLTYGFSLHYPVYKRRGGDNADPKQNSAYNDGKFGWRKIPIRAQDTITGWTYDDADNPISATQTLWTRGEMIDLPLSRCLLFRYGIHKDNPEGRSLLRNAYRPWYFKKHIEALEAIGVERDLAGLPVIKRDESLKQFDDDFQYILRNIKKDEQAGVLLPLAWNVDGKPLLEFELLSSSGSRQIDTNTIISRYDFAILMTLVAEFIKLGQQAVGSFALADSKTNMFSAGLGAIVKSIAGVLNQHAVSRLLRFNGMPIDKGTEIVPGDIENIDIAVISDALLKFSTAGAPVFPDDRLLKHLFALMNLPAPEENPPPQPTIPVPAG